MGADRGVGVGVRGWGGGGGGVLLILLKRDISGHVQVSAVS